MTAAIQAFEEAHLNMARVPEISAKRLPFAHELKLQTLCACSNVPPSRHLIRRREAVPCHFEISKRPLQSTVPIIYKFLRGLPLLFYFHHAHGPLHVEAGSEQSEQR